ncbi:hypothetical protein Pd630_LPD02347 [Rhodococcus opacus PD630]|jgi:hypothetical protein|nr:hypothetical protein Pd630_LPD02347 [Rhodococcus opacus PD630]
MRFFAEIGLVLSAVLVDGSPAQIGKKVCSVISSAASIVQRDAR